MGSSLSEKKYKDFTNQAVVLLGKIGHGKTRLFNHLCGTAHLSCSSASSCTRTLQFSYSTQHRLQIIDTPGYGSSDDPDAHMQAQRAAIEQYDLSGMYVVVKYGAPGDMADSLNRLMDFSGNEDVRVIVTHLDIAMEQNPEFNVGVVQSKLGDLVRVPVEHILVTGIHTPPNAIEDFVLRTLHAPKRFVVEPDQAVYASAFTMGARRFHQDLNALATSIEAISTACTTLQTNLPRMHGEDLQNHLSWLGSATFYQFTTDIEELRQHAGSVLNPEGLMVFEKMLDRSVVQRLNEFHQTVASQTGGSANVDPPRHRDGPNHEASGGVGWVPFQSTFESRNRPSLGPNHRDPHPVTVAPTLQTERSASTHRHVVEGGVAKPGIPSCDPPTVYDSSERPEGCYKDVGHESRLAAPNRYPQPRGWCQGFRAAVGNSNRSHGVGNSTNGQYSSLAPSQDTLREDAPVTTSLSHNNTTQCDERHV